MSNSISDPRRRILWFASLAALVVIVLIARTERRAETGEKEARAALQHYREIESRLLRGDRKALGELADGIEQRAYSSTGVAIARRTIAGIDAVSDRELSEWIRRNTDDLVFDNQMHLFIARGDAESLSAPEDATP